MSASGSTLPTVLSLDDSPVVQALIQLALGVEYRLLLCTTAIQALSLLNQEPVAVLLLDISMPEINGLDFCRTIRSIPKFQNLPIVMLTARDRSFDKVGSSGLVVKQRGLLIASLERCIQKPCWIRIS
jgi:twitching motility two-component system response regulator PilG